MTFIYLSSTLHEIVPVTAGERIVGLTLNESLIGASANTNSCTN